MKKLMNKYTKWFEANIGAIILVMWTMMGSMRIAYANSVMVYGANIETTVPWAWLQHVEDALCCPPVMYTFGVLAIAFGIWSYASIRKLEKSSN